jgi:hypothetical protein
VGLPRRTGFEGLMEPICRPGFGFAPLVLSSIPGQVLVREVASSGYSGYAHDFIDCIGKDLSDQRGIGDTRDTACASNPGGCGFGDQTIYPAGDQDWFALNNASVSGWRVVSQPRVDPDGPNAGGPGPATMDVYVNGTLRASGVDNFCTGTLNSQFYETQAAEPREKTPPLVA